MSVLSFCLPSERDFVDKYVFQLIYSVSNIEQILDELFTQRVIQQYHYDKIRALPTSKKKMRELFHHLLTTGVRGKVIFYNIIEKLEPYLIENIKDIDISP